MIEFDAKHRLLADWNSLFCMKVEYSILYSNILRTIVSAISFISVIRMNAVLL